MTDFEILHAGKCTFTLEGSGKRYTYRITEKEGRDGEIIYFVSLLTGPDNESAYTYLGMMDNRHCLRLTKASRLPDDSDPVKGFRWVYTKLLCGLPAGNLPGGFRVLWADRCQRCGRTLTVPSSIDARLGPECATKCRYSPLAN